MFADQSLKMMRLRDAVSAIALNRILCALQSEAQARERWDTDTHTWVTDVTTLPISVDIMLRSGDVRIALEYDGPTHFMTPFRAHDRSAAMHDRDADMHGSGADMHTSGADTHGIGTDMHGSGTDMHGSGTDMYGSSAGMYGDALRERCGAGGERVRGRRQAVPMGHTLLRDWMLRRRGFGVVSVTPMDIGECVSQFRTADFKRLLLARVQAELALQRDLHSKRCVSNRFIGGDEFSWNQGICVMT